MEWLIFAILFAVVIVQFLYNQSTKKKLHEICNVLDDVCDGNLDRRLLANENTVISELVYKINDIVIQNKNKFLEAEKAEMAYKKMVTSLSHDIRTPLTSLIGYLEVLENNSCQGDERNEFLKIAKKKALDLSDYIQSLFEWMKLESGEWVYHFEKENICEQTRIILADWIMKLEQAQIGFQFEIPEKASYVVIDKKVYERIINNVLSNVMKHSKADFIRITLNCNALEIWMEITDNGVGIAKQDLPFIFERLYKCDSSRTDNSNGLGLAIAKELTAVLGGTISVNSEPSSGTSFVLKLPYKHE